MMKTKKKKKIKIKKKCPFCKGKGILEYVDDLAAYEGCYVRCDDCWARTGIFRSRIPAKMEQEAIEAWERRDG